MWGYTPPTRFRLQYVASDSVRREKMSTRSRKDALSVITCSSSAPSGQARWLKKNLNSFGSAALLSTRSSAAAKPPTNSPVSPNALAPEMSCECTMIATEPPCCVPAWSRGFAKGFGGGARRGCVVCGREHREGTFSKGNRGRPRTLLLARQAVYSVIPVTLVAV